MVLKSALTTALAQGEPCIGFWLTYNAPPLAKTILACGGYNWVLVDAEHGQITDADYYVLSNLIASAGASPIIRIPNDQEWMIKRALDAGAHGIMVPMCHTADDARRIVKYCKYPPVGTRGFGPMFSAHSFGVADVDYAPNADASTLVIVQIESRQAVNNVEEIAAVEGVDVVFVGPFDLSKFMNVPFGGEEHEAAIARTLKAAKAHRKTAAIFCSNGIIANQRLHQGFDMVSATTDVAAIVSEFDRQLQLTRGTTGASTASVY